MMASRRVISAPRKRRRKKKKRNQINQFLSVASAGTLQIQLKILFFQYVHAKVVLGTCTMIVSKDG